ncbi:PfkB family carbohydrate kinase [Roseomonas populi]|uniref:PfkB family carbohydrate kinase n=1 Tax=Roseomonas populi TaxID=3121582 RepID=UPI0038CD71B1
MIDFDGQRVLCLGDVMLDRFYYGQIDRLSPEAPVPVVRMKENRAMLGGAGNVARNIASLGGEAVLMGIVGDDAAGRELAALVEATPGMVDAKRDDAAFYAGASALTPTPNLPVWHRRKRPRGIILDPLSPLPVQEEAIFTIGDCEADMYAG